jgi:hypothetical protein
MSQDAPVNSGVVAWPDIVSARAAVARMQTKLHRWAGADASRRFGDLFNLAYSPAFLQVAWQRVSASKGGRVLPGATDSPSARSSRALGLRRSWTRSAHGHPARRHAGIELTELSATLCLPRLGEPVPGLGAVPDNGEAPGRAAQQQHVPLCVGQFLGLVHDDVRERAGERLRVGAGQRGRRSGCPAGPVRAASSPRLRRRHRPGEGCR